MPDIREQLLAAFKLEHREHLDAIRASLVRVASGETADLREGFRRAHSLKGAARAVDLPDIEEAAHSLESLFAAAQEPGVAPTPDVIARARRLLDHIETRAARIFSGAREPSTPVANPESWATAAPVEYIRVDAEQIQRLDARVRELETAIDALDASGPALVELQRRTEALAAALERDLRRLAKAETAGLDGLAIEARALARSLSAAGRRQRQDAWALGSSAGRIRQEVDRVSLAPAETVFAGLDSMMQALAAERGAAIDLKLEGLDVLADRRLLQSLRDPVIHLLRNALAHGVEPVAERVAAGKPATVEIGLAFRASGGRLEIVVWDDGRGPDLAAIEKAGVAKGLLSPRLPGQPERSAELLMPLVFEPGFSTAGAVGRIAGRGVGLSVVAEAARDAGGTAYMRARRPWGAEAVIDTPLSAARQAILILNSGRDLYGLPSHAVERVAAYPTSALESLDGRTVIREEIDGNPLVTPVVLLADALGVQPSPVQESEVVHVVTLKHAGRRLGLAVEAVEDIRVLTVVAIGDEETDLVSGAVQLDAGRVASVIDPEVVLNRHARNELRATPAAAPAPARRARHTVLVVDDSITTRTLEKSILEANGYRVVTCVDGLDALNTLRAAETPVDVVVADIEMPRMDGFQLLQALKNDPGLSSIPVILMTSRADPDAVSRGLELGADAYLVKQKFDQRELLSTIGQLL